MLASLAVRAALVAAPLAIGALNVVATVAADAISDALINKRIERSARKAQRVADASNPESVTILCDATGAQLI